MVQGAITHAMNDCAQMSGFHLSHGNCRHWRLNHILKNLGISQLTIILQFALFESINSPTLSKSFGFVDQPALISFILFSYVIGPVRVRSDEFMSVCSRDNCWVRLSELGAHHQILPYQ